MNVEKVIKLFLNNPTKLINISTYMFSLNSHILFNLILILALY